MSIFTDRQANEWGEAMNFDGPGSSGVREFFIQNACYWINEFHMDGLRLDAVHAIHDDEPVHVDSRPIPASAGRQQGTAR